MTYIKKHSYVQRANPVGTMIQYKKPIPQIQRNYPIGA